MTHAHSTTDAAHMRRALELARLGEGFVEPNPMVGCVIAHGDRIVGEGYHPSFGGPHAERKALHAAGEAARDATMYVTLEPCCHHGKTAPCTDAILAAGIRRVVVAQRDPFPQVDGGGIDVLRDDGLKIDLGVLESEAQSLNAPYLKLIKTGWPWVIAKWAMTLDGKIATHTGDSQWISNEQSRAVVHRLRGRVDAILVGSGTARADDPRLTARPSGPRTAARVVLDTNASLSLDSQLVKSIDDAPVLIATGTRVPSDKIDGLVGAGCEVLPLEGDSNEERLVVLLKELGQRRMTNVLVEGGAEVLGSFHDANLIDEAHIFIGPKLVGGASAPGPISGAGVGQLGDARILSQVVVEQLGNDIYVRGRVARGDGI